MQRAARDATDEIQVYDAEINNPEEFSLQLHRLCQFKEPLQSHPPMVVI
jgi:hypothetical protein